MASPLGQNTDQTTRLSRAALLICLFAVIFLVIGGRLVFLALQHTSGQFHTASVAPTKTSHRPDIIDRNGRLLASDVTMDSLIADPKKILDIDETLEKLLTVLPSLDAKSLRAKLEKKRSRFAWVKRGLTPDEAAAAHNLGLPGLSFVSEPRRIYPAGATAAHILGYVDIDNLGKAGIEAYIDKVQGLYFPKLKEASAKPAIRLSIDIGVQHVLREELAKSIEQYRAKAAAGIILNVNNGEVVAMSSLPDYDPNHPTGALQKDSFNRITNGTFELGSVFKTFTVAMALDAGDANLKTKFDASSPIKIAKFIIRDYHPQNRQLSLSEVFTYSSNIGAARIAQSVGPQRHQDFLRGLGLLNPITTELGPVRAPQAPQRWRAIRSMTISYGHGISVAPLQFATAAAVLVNGGYSVSPTFLKRKSHKADTREQLVIAPETSDTIRKLLRLNVTNGTGRNADAPGFKVGGKTGTADKPANGGYDRKRLLTTFLSTFPTDDPAYILFVMLDEPQPDKAKPGRRPTAGTNVAPTTARIISRVAPMLGLLPRS